MKVNTPNCFPFSAIQGQQTLKLALILCAINPAIGGVLISGPRGSAKTTLARALAALLPSEQSDSAFVTLPLGASEEMLSGSLDIQQVLNDRKIDFSPGLLAKADGGVLYVDEVNLLPDPLIDQLLDVAASGVNRVERDGISHSHRSVFSLIGTMNPDEGELRPQLLDRFGLMVLLNTQLSIEQRIDVVKLREAYDRDPQSFNDSYAEQQQALSLQIISARQSLTSIHCADEQRLHIATCCSEAQVDGVRADIVMYRAALAHAAWRGSDQIESVDIEAVVELVLEHRRRESQSKNNSGPGNSPSQQQAPSSGFSRPNEASNPAKETQSKGQSGSDWGSMANLQTPLSSQERYPECLAQIESFFTSSSRVSSKGYIKQYFAKRAGNSVTGIKQGRFASQRIHWLRTLAKSVVSWPTLNMAWHKRRDGERVLHLVLLDTSASTLGGQLSAQSKSLVLSIAEQAYLRRDHLQLVSFGNDSATPLFNSTKAMKHIAKQIDNLSVGGGTPLRSALQQAARCIRRHSHDAMTVRCYLITDGRTKAQVTDLALGAQTIVIDTEQASVKRGRALSIAQQLGAAYLPLHTQSRAAAL